MLASGTHAPYIIFPFRGENIIIFVSSIWVRSIPSFGIPMVSIVIPNMEFPFKWDFTRKSRYHMYTDFNPIGGNISMGSYINDNITYNWILGPNIATL